MLSRARLRGVGLLGEELLNPRNEGPLIEGGSARAGFAGSVRPGVNSAVVALGVETGTGRC